MTPLFALGTVLCVLFCGITLDVGRMELLKVRMQSAADAAAVGAELEAEHNTWNWQTMGQSDASTNGFTNGQNGATVTIVQDPTSGPYAGRYDAIQVTITQTYKTLFMGIASGGTWTLTVQSVSLMPTCTYFLGGQSASYSPTFQNASATLNAGCPIYINYNYIVDGFSDMFGFGVNVSGTSAESSPENWESQQSLGPIWPEVGNTGTFSQPVVADPLASVITQPTFNGTCLHTSYSIASGTATLNPGNYCGTSSTVGMTITNATVTLNPGLYIITGGATWNKSTITGDGVTLFFTNGNGAGYGQFLVANQSSGQCTLTFSAPTTTANNGIPGILFFMDRNWVATAAADFSFNTYNTFTGDGIWYMPNTGVYVWLNTFSIPNYGSIIARNMYFFGTTIDLNENFSWLSGGSPFRTKSVLVQ